MVMRGQFRGQVYRFGSVSQVLNGGERTVGCVSVL